MATITGTNESNILNGTHGADRIWSREGGDTLTGNGSEGVRVSSHVWTRLKPEEPPFRDIDKHNTRELGRVLYSHDWTDLREWATAFDELGNLTDDEIVALVEDRQREPRLAA